ncbi:unnamed protein product [Blepharisma stoltei]|uniref:Cyclic nucleotide-binding domain-containing protein n=1 Tax=Blepharisma stoltei TaxID=1481888 RepID=A0AAU9ISI7_9CILI|nr:unnamed protein product [Blepharisma stoltei]
MTNRKLIDDIKDAFLNQDKSDTDVNKLKRIFKENQILRAIPPNQRHELCANMTLHEYHILDTCISEKDKKPDFFIAVSGKLSSKNKDRQEIIHEPFGLFGYTKPLNGISYIPGRVISKEHSYVISIPRQIVKAEMEKINKFQESIKVLDFLVKTVPGLRQLGHASKERILKLFEICTFKNGDTILQEGVHATHAFIIEEGQCRQVSAGNSSRPSTSRARGLISKTTSTYNFGLVMPGQWIGEDSVLLNKPMDLSVIAATVVKALKISKEKFLEGLTRDTQHALKENLIKKLEWREHRKSDISQTIYSTLFIDNFTETINAQEQIEKNYPTASKMALTSIQRREAAKSDGGLHPLLNSSYSNKVYARTPSPEPEAKNLSPKRASFEKSYPNQGKARSQSSDLTTRRVSYQNIKPGAQSNVFSSQQLAVSNLGHIRKPKVRLHSAATLGRSLVPTFPEKKFNRIEKPQHVVSARVDPVISFVEVRDEQNESFGKKIRKGRPLSPNPVEVWARKHNLDIKQLTGRSPVKPVPPINA